MNAITTPSPTPGDERPNAIYPEMRGLFSFCCQILSNLIHPVRLKFRWLTEVGKACSDEEFRLCFVARAAAGQSGLKLFSDSPGAVHGIVANTGSATTAPVRQQPLR